MKISLLRLAAAAALLAAGGAACAQATITHDKALTGNVTPGDTAGYPITISQPGSYKLMSNLVVPPETSGIVVNSHGVTIDLNGFTISGPGSCSRNTYTRVVTCAGGSYVGIYAGANDGTVIRNGTVRGFNNGISLGKEGFVENVLVTQNATEGIWSSEFGAQVQLVGVRAVLNGGHGIHLGSGSITRVTASQNGKDGIHGAWTNAIQVMDSSADSNAWLGFRGVTLRSSMISGQGQSDRSLVRSLGGNADEVGSY